MTLEPSTKTVAEMADVVTPAPVLPPQGWTVAGGGLGLPALLTVSTAVAPSPLDPPPASGPRRSGWLVAAGAAESPDTPES